MTSTEILALTAIPTPRSIVASDNGAVYFIPANVSGANAAKAHTGDSLSALTIMERKAIRDGLEVSSLRGPRTIFVEATGGLVENGNKLRQAVIDANAIADLLPSPYYDTGGVTVVLSPGTYDLGTNNGVTLHEKVSLTGMTTAREGTVIVGGVDVVDAGLVKMLYGSCLQDLTLNNVSGTLVPSIDGQSPSKGAGAALMIHSPSALYGRATNRIKNVGIESFRYGRGTGTTLATTEVSIAVENVVSTRDIFSNVNYSEHTSFINCQGGEYSFGYNCVSRAHIKGCYGGGVNNFCSESSNFGVIEDCSTSGSPGNFISNGVNEATGVVRRCRVINDSGGAYPFETMGYMCVNHGLFEDCYATAGSYMLAFAENHGVVRRCRIDKAMGGIGGNFLMPDLGINYGIFEDCTLGGTVDHGNNFAGDNYGIIRNCKVPSNIFCKNSIMDGKFENMRMDLSDDVGPISIGALFDRCKLRILVGTSIFDMGTYAEAQPITISRFDNCVFDADVFEFAGWSTLILLLEQPFFNVVHCSVVKTGGRKFIDTTDGGFYPGRVHEMDNFEGQSAYY